MSVMRVEKDEDYTVVSNFYLKDKRLSLKGKGLLTTMLSLPENWDYSIEGLAALSDDGRCSVVTAIKELEELGYLRRSTAYEKDTRKFLGNEYRIYEMPFAKIHDKYGDFSKFCKENL